MANTFTNLNFHIIFSTRKRERLLTPSIENRIWAYLGGVVKSLGAEPLCIGGVEDHVHLLVRLPAKHGVAKVVQSIKGASSHWMNEEMMKQGILHGRLDMPPLVSVNQIFLVWLNISKTSGNIIKPRISSWSMFRS